LGEFSPFSTVKSYAILTIMGWATFWAIISRNKLLWSPWLCPVRIGVHRNLCRRITVSQNNIAADVGESLSHMKKWPFSLGILLMLVVHRWIPTYICTYAHTLPSAILRPRSSPTCRNGIICDSQFLSSPNQSNQKCVCLFLALRHGQWIKASQKNCSGSILSIWIYEGFLLFDLYSITKQKLRLSFVIRKML
jgi:hypothetical protein